MVLVMVLVRLSPRQQ